MSSTDRTPSFRKRPMLGKFVAGIAVAVGLSTITLPAKAQPKPAPESVVRLSGSSTIGAKLALELATAWAKQLKLPGVRIDGGLDPDEYDIIAEGAESTQKMRVQVRAKGTTTGLEPLLRGQSDIWMASRPVRDTDIDAMRKRNVPNVPTLAQLQQPGRAPSPAVRDFMQFALGPVGQTVVVASGFADLSPSKADANYAGDRLDSAREAMDGGRTRVRAPDVKAFEATISGADRLSITFRFQSGTNTLDSRAEADVGRLAALMQSPAYSNSIVTLVG